MVIGPNHRFKAIAVSRHVFEGIFTLPAGQRGGPGQTVQGRHQIGPGHGVVGPESGVGLAVDQALFRHLSHILLCPAGHVGVLRRVRGEGSAGQAKGQDHRQQQRQRFAQVPHAAISSLKYLFSLFPCTARPRHRGDSNCRTHEKAPRAKYTKRNEQSPIPAMACAG